MALDFLIILIVLFFSIILHECAHGYAAFLLGDPTAKEAGRLSLNPLKHIDPVGTVILPVCLILMRLMGYHTFLFGWAKPVPVNFFRLRRPKRDMMWVGLSGPATNIGLAFLFSRLLLIPASPQVSEIIGAGVFINLLLAVFNLIPIPPLDGSRLVMGLLPKDLAVPYARLEPYGIMIVIFLLYAGMLNRIVWPAIHFFAQLMGVQI